MSSNEQCRNVWYCLVQPNGDPYKQTLSHHVLFNPGDTISDFRRAVMLNDAAILKNITASQLCVYSTKDSLDKAIKKKALLDMRNNASISTKKQRVDELGRKDLHEKERQPLVSWYSVGDLGMTAPEASMVVVPDIVKDQREYRHPPDDAFSPCVFPFFTKFPDVVEDNCWLRFTSSIPMTGIQNLFIRSAYRSIADTALSKRKSTPFAHPTLSAEELKSMDDVALTNENDIKRALISGTPGIGKSLFLYYVLWRLVKEEKRVLILSSCSLMIYFDGQTMWECTHLPATTMHQFWTPDLWCLVDSRDPTLILPVHACSVLLVSTPRHDCANAFNKIGPTPDRLYMPIWTLDEIEAIESLYPDATNVWTSRYEHLGGIPRLIFQNLDEEPSAILKTACLECPLDLCLQVVTNQLQYV